MRKRRGAGRRRIAVRGGGGVGGRRPGRRRPRATEAGDTDDGDEEYVAGEEESSGGSSPATPGGSDEEEEEEFQFGDSSDEEAAATAEVELDDEEEEGEEEEDDDLLEASRSVPRRGRGNRTNGRMRKFRVSDEEELGESRSKPPQRVSCNNRNGNVRKFRVSDDEEEGEELELENLRWKSRRASSRKRNGMVNKFRVSDVDEEGEAGEISRQKPRGNSRNNHNVTVNNFVVLDNDDDEPEEGLAPRRIETKSSVRRPRRNSVDSDYEVDEEEELEDGFAPRRKNAKSSFRPPRRNSIDSDYELDEEEELEDGSAPKRNETKSSVRPPMRNSVDSDYELDEEEELEDGSAPRRKGTKSSVRPPRRNSVDSDYELDEEEELEDGSAPKRNATKSSVRPPRRNSVDSDYEVDEEEEDDEEDYVDDEDFSLDAEDADDGEGSSNLKIASNMRQRQKSRAKEKGRKGRPKRSEYDDDFLVEEDEGRKRRSRRSNYDDEFIVDEDKQRKRRPRRSEYDDDFIVEDKETKRRPRRSEYDDDFVVDEDEDSKHRKRKKAGKSNKKKRNKRARMAMKSPDSEASDPDFVSSDDDFEEKDKVALNHQRRRIKNGKKGNRGGSRKLKISSDRSESSSSSSSSDSDFEISEEELRDLGIVEGVLNRPQPKRVFAERKEEDKGKEKVNDESGKQVCGICLSEEQKRTVQGVLNCCAHYFCFACIVAWSKVESRCPVCKRRFETITKSSRSDSTLEPKKAVIMVQKRDQVYQPSEEEIRRMLDPYENVVCMECQQGGDDSLMLLCDICDSSAHTYCVGLGREVPEGNWYCECCRSATDGLLYPQHQDTVSDHQANNLEFSVRSTETEGAGDACADAELQRPISLPGQHTIRGFDLNVSPRLDEDYVATSQASGGGASTLSGRREIHRRIRLILSISRRNQNTSGSVIPQNLQRDVIISENERPAGSLNGSDGMILLNPVLSAGPCPQNTTPSFQSNANIVPCTYNAGSSFRHVEGAKEQVQSMVKRHLKDLSRELQLEHATFKDIVSRSTHTILAACGIEHKRRMVSSSVHPPSNCSHYLDHEPAHLVDSCCSFCFNSFVKDVVQNLLHAI